MTVETKKVQGKVARINLWTNKPGYFINLENDQNEYFGYGSCKAKLGEIVDLEVSEGTGNFKDKFKVEKIHCGVTVKQVEKETHDKDMEILDKSIESGEKTYFDTKNIINRQSGAKSSAPVVAAMIRAGLLKTKIEIAEAHLYLADKIYFYITEQEESLPEPPEEP